MADKFKRTVGVIDEAIRAHVREHKEEPSVVTGWVFVAAVSESDYPDRDGYVVQSSLGMQHHSEVGLLQMAIDDKRNFGILATLSSVMRDDDTDYS